MEHSRLEQLVTLLAIALVAAGLYFVATPPADRAMPAAPILPTLQPTPALVVPTPRPTVEVVYEQHSSVTYVNIDQDVNVCIGLCR